VSKNIFHCKKDRERWSTWTIPWASTEFSNRVKRAAAARDSLIFMIIHTQSAAHSLIYKEKKKEKKSTLFLYSFHSTF